MEITTAIAVATVSTGIDLHIDIGHHIDIDLDSATADRHEVEPARCFINHSPRMAASENAQAASTTQPARRHSRGAV